MNDPAFFGYGSLVNLGTHDYADPTPAALTGWRRVWCSTHVRDVAFLSVERCAKTDIKGVIAHVPGADWAALDKREAAYQRHDVTAEVRHHSPTAVYQVAAAHLYDADPQPILLSYLDVVVQGYLKIFGEEGVTHFFETTTGWRPVLDDRAVPQYPRHQLLSTTEKSLVDDHLAAVMQDAK